ncbi:hypothetical protein [Parasediminibacterium sp. JCM 36343]|uniref:hypothetical protein n=1 Tax=Parasediminibacterium sp. JCM 36343 TaxID=3374279 RepID=UPI0039789480
MPNTLRLTPDTSYFVTIPAKIISYIFHPLFIPTYIFMYLQYQYRFEFAGITEWQMKLKLFSTFWMTAFFPAFAVFLLWRLKFSDSIFLGTQKERIIPYFISMFFYWWMYYLSTRTFTDQPEVLKFFYFGIFAAASIGVIINNYIKISLHGMAMGGALAAIILFSFFYQTPAGLAISIITLLTGIVCTARLLVSNHTKLEVYSGVLLGVACQLIGYWFVQL